MTTLARPVPADMTSYSRGFGGGHNGIDYGWTTSAPIPVLAAHDGVVLDVVSHFRDNGSLNNQDNQGWGNRIRVDHGNGLVTTYNHLQQGSAVVSAGQRVSRGQKLALMGHSGRSTGRHLHWELYRNGSRIDPEPYRTQDLPGLGGGGTPAGPGSTANVSIGQRTPVAGGARRRAQPTTKANETGDILMSVGDFDGWIHGESVSGNDVWYRGKYSGDWFWSGGFTEGANGTGLTDLNQQATKGNQRTTVSIGANGRATPSSKAAINQTLAGGIVADFESWTRGESIEGNDVWFKGAYSGDWFWSGGFTNSTTAGILEVATPPVTPPVPTATPRTPTYPGAIEGWTVPLSSDRDAGSVINRLIVHHTTNTGSDAPYFKTKNDRGSCPTWYVMKDGAVIEFIAPDKRPSATGKANTYSVAVETQNTSGDPTWGISDESHEAIAKIAAWLYTLDGKSLGGFPVEFELDRSHIIGHNEAGAGATACPGPSMDLDRIVRRAREIADPVIVVPPTPDTVLVPKSWVEALIEKLKGFLT